MTGALFLFLCMLLLVSVFKWYKIQKYQIYVVIFFVPNNRMLLNGCFYTGLVTGLRAVILA